MIQFGRGTAGIKPAAILRMKRKVNCVALLILALFASMPSFAQTAAECRKRFESSVCLQSKSTTFLERSRAHKYAKDPILAQRDYEKPLRNPVCDPSNSRYVQLLIASYDRLPPASKKVLCDVRTTFIVHHPIGLGQVEALYDTNDFEYSKNPPAHIGNQTGTMVHLWPEAFVLFLDETLFTEPRKETEYRKEGFDVRYLQSVPREMVPYHEWGNLSTLDKVLLHESGHLLASANRVQSFGIYAHWNKSFDPNWYNISFAPSGVQEWKLREGGEELLAQYNQRKPLWTLATVPEFVSFLRKGGFPTILAARNPAEDFAESYAAHVTGFRLILNGKILYSSTDPDALVWKRKQVYIDNLLNSPNIKYKAEDAGWVLDIIWTEDVESR
jgi:hypothetical protein